MTVATAGVVYASGGASLVMTWVSAAVIIGLASAICLLMRQVAQLAVQNEWLQQESVALNTHALVLRTDAAGTITGVNDKFLASTGFSQNELLGQSVEALYYPEDQERRLGLKAMVDDGGTWQGEIRMRRKSGDELWSNLTILPGIDAHGRIGGAISVRSDITEVKRMRTNEDVFRALNRLTDQVVIHGLDNGVLDYANESARRAFGLPNEGKATIRLTDLHPVFRDKSFTDALDTLRQSGGDFAVCELSMDGRHFEVRLQMLDGNHGRQLVLTCLHDVSERVAAEKARSEFISTVSHELRSPMTSVKGALGLLLAGSTGAVPENARRVLDIAHRNADRLINIINDLLDIEKIAAGKMSFDYAPYAVSAIVNEAVIANESYSRRFDVTIDMKGDLDSIVAVDFGRSLQVLNNLISNAAKYSPPGGRIVVSGRDVGDFVAISVTDSGKGIPADMTEKVFEKFSQIEHDPNGPVRSTGLGLAIVKAIVEEQGGRVWLESTPGKGSTFSVTFPKARHVPAGLNAEMVLERAS